MTTVEQSKTRRAGVGLRALDPELASPGFTLFTPGGANQTVYLISLDGAVTHTWQMPHPPGLYGRLTERDTLLYCGKVTERSDRFISGQPWKGGAVFEVDWNGRVLWEVRHPDHHHDAALLRNGNVLLLCLAELPPKIAARVRGGRPGTEHLGKIHADYLIEMTIDGRVVWEWRSWEHLDPDAHPISAVQDSRDEWTHGNAVEELPNGDLLLSFRNPSTVLIVSRQTGQVRWTLGAPPLAQQHAPNLLPNGHILIFDNGTHRLDHNIPHSRVLEVDPSDNQIVWSYEGRPIADFFSSHISNAQRLANGNTLICEGVHGRFFEVTPEGDLVWEYINPFFHPPAENPASLAGNRVFRAYRYAPDTIERARRGSR